MQIKHDITGYRFTAVSDEGKETGYIEYAPAGNGLRATHTLVYPEFEGKGIAGKLLDALAEYAATNSLKIEPVCSYVVRAFEKYPEKYKNVINNKTSQTL